MTHDLLAALVLFVFVATVTPGPNNLMVMASGANFGFRRTVPHMLGIGIGFSLMVLLVGVGLAQVFNAFPPLYQVLKAASIAYLLYLAWKIAHAAPVKQGAAEGRPMTFLQAAAFQWVNPKAWTMAITATTAYAPSQTLAAMGLIALTFGLVCFPVVSTWTLAGQQLARLLTSPSRLTIFNWTMATLLVASLIPVILP
ncbi:LysE family translocator [Marinibacterium profundimaris]|uniref:Membrane protein n=1 Tax=Marinibacterium profundimaris TaxID=1679460 RepID=A0A225NI54_9RHOB|nr:LysE family translocator [Marinibacterium profundimaris]OWU73424.1 membrane protein [Marinibacterium profundimaris]